MADLQYLIILIAGFGFLGGGIKYVDQAFDENLYNRKLAYLTALACGILMGWFIAMDYQAAAILIAIVLGVAITRKIDNLAFMAGTLLVLATPLVVGYSAKLILINWPLLLALTVAAIVDEVGNDLADDGKIKGWTGKFFEYRSTMKVAVLGVFAAGFLGGEYVAAFFAFDIAYTLVDIHSTRLLGWRRQNIHHAVTRAYKLIE